MKTILQPALRDYPENILFKKNKLFTYALLDR